MASFDEYGVGIVLGCNGLIWVGLQNSKAGEKNTEENVFTSIARICQAIRALAKLAMVISVESISKVLDLSLRHGIHPSSMEHQDFLRVMQTELF